MGPQGAGGWNQPFRPIPPLLALGRAMVLLQHKVAEKEVAQRQEAKSQAANFRSGAALDKPWHRNMEMGEGKMSEERR